MQSLRNETADAHKYMVHMFASETLFSEHYFMDRLEALEIPSAEFEEGHVLSPGEYALIQSGYFKLVIDIFGVCLPQLQFTQESVPKNIAEDEVETHCVTTLLYSLPVLPFNEQYYQDGVNILDHYE